MAASAAVIGDQGKAATPSVKPSLLMRRLLPADVASIACPEFTKEQLNGPVVGSDPKQKDWEILFSRIQHAGTHIREMKSQSEEQNTRVQELLDQVHLDMKAASDRVRAAEQRALDIKERANRLILAAEKRAEAAEHNTRLARDQFAAISDLINQEFPIVD